MSGGSFDYSQYHITTIADSIQSYLDRQGDDREESWCKGEIYTIYPLEVEEKLKEAVYILKKAAIYAHRADWYFAGDDGEDTFLERLAYELENLEASFDKK